MTDVEGFEAQLRHQLRAVGTEVAPAPGLAERVASARRRQARQRRTQRLATAGGIAVAAAVLGVFVVPLPGTDVEAVGVAAASEATAATSFRFTTEVEGLGSPMRAQGEVGAGAEEARLRTTLPLDELTGADGAKRGVEVVLADGSLFVDVRALGGVVPGAEGVEWLGVDLEGGGYADRLAASLIDTVGDVDPTRALELLDEVAEESVEDGREEVDGVPTTRYRFRAVVDVDLDLDLAPGGGPAEAAEAAEVEVGGRAWVDDDGRLRRIEVREEGVTATTELSDFGVDVDIDPPPPERVRRLDELVAGLGDGG